VCPGAGQFHSEARRLRVLLARERRFDDHEAVGVRPEILQAEAENRLAVRERKQSKISPDIGSPASGGPAAVPGPIEP